MTRGALSREATPFIPFTSFLWSVHCFSNRCCSVPRCWRVSRSSCDKLASFCKAAFWRSPLIAVSNKMRHQITVHVQQDSTAVISWLTGIGAWPFCYPSAVARQRNLESWPNEIKFRNHPSRTRKPAGTNGETLIRSSRQCFNSQKLKSNTFNRYI